VSQNDLEIQIITAINDVGQMLGHPPGNLTVNTCPHKHLSWFDSQLGLLTSVELSTRLGQTLPDINLFADGSKALPISEVAKKVDVLLAVPS
jgi:hypothetical protein